MDEETMKKEEIEEKVSLTFHAFFSVQIVVYCESTQLVDS